MSKQLLRSGTAIGALVREAKTQKLPKTSFINWAYHKKNVMKPSTGWNY